MMQSRLILTGLIVANLSLAMQLQGQTSTDESQLITPAQREAVREARRQMLQQPRRLIFNSDGAEVLLAKSPTRQAFLDSRLTSLIDSQVDMLFYSPIGAGLSMFTHRTQVGEILASRDKQLKDNLTAELHANGLDPLQLAIDFGEDQQMPVFFSLRMNDKHDESHTPENPNPMFPEWKKQHPELLFGTPEDKPKFGRWTQHDYGQPEVRERVYSLLEEACRNYAIGGLELDFFRHPALFRRVGREGVSATDEEIEVMTDLMRRIRAMTEREAVRRGGEPYLIAVRVPDSVEACRWMGIDLEGWMAQGLIDIYIPSGYFRFNSWQTSVELAHRHGVKVYACLNSSRAPNLEGVRDPFRRSDKSYRARAAQAWEAGVDGIYSFNEYNPHRPYLHEIGSPETLVGLDKVYFASVRGQDWPTAWFAHGMSYFNASTLAPKNPVKLTRGHRGGAMLELLIADDLASYTDEDAPVVTLRVQLDPLELAEAVNVALNGRTLAEGRVVGNKLVFDLDPVLLRRGTNRFEVLLHADAKKDVNLQDLQVLIDYPQDDSPWPERGDDE